MNFTLHQLKIFLEVAKIENITKAAEEMYMSQPALSIQLKNFQSQFEIPLFDKVGKHIQLTEFGKSISEIAENILQETEKLKFKSKEYNGLITGKLKISSASTGKYVIPFFLSEFLNQHSGIDLILDVSNKTKVMENIKNNEVDFALVSVLPEIFDVEEELLLENKLLLVGKTGDYYEDAPLIYREEGSATRAVMENTIGSPEKRKSMMLTSNEAVKQAVIAGLGFSVLPLIGMRNEIDNKKLHIIPSKGLPVNTFWRLIWRKNKKLSPVAAAYLEYLKSNKAKIIEEHFSWYRDFTPL